MDLENAGAAFVMSKAPKNSQAGCGDGPVVKRVSLDHTRQDREMTH